MLQRKVNILLINPSQKDESFFKALSQNVSSTELQIDFHIASLADENGSSTPAPPQIIFLLLATLENPIEKTLFQLKKIAPNVPIVPILDDDDAAWQSKLRGLGVQDYLVKSDLNARWLVYFINGLLATRKEQQQVQSQINRYRQILNATGEGILGIDLNDNHTFVNQRAAEMLGYRVEEMLGRPSHKMWHHTHVDGTPYPLQDCPIYDVYKKGKIASGTDLFWRKDGTSFPVTFIATPILANEKLTGVIVLFRDITRRSKAERALAQSAKAFSTFVNDIPIGVFRTTFGGEKLAANPALLDMLGYKSLEEYRAMDETEHNRIFGLPQAQFETILKEEGDVRGLEAVWHKKDGTPIYVRENARIVKDADGNALYYEGTLEDVSQEKADEESRRLYEFIVNSSNQMMTLIAENYTYAAVSDAYCRAHSRKRSDLVGKKVSEVWGAEIYRQAIQAKVEACFAGETLRFREWVNFPEDGLGRRFIEATYSPYISPDGDITHIVVVSTDITEAESARAALMESEIRYRNLFEFAPDGVLIVDAGGVITQCSQTAAKLYGYPKTEIVGKHLTHFLTPASLEIFKVKFPNLYQLKAVDGEIKIITKKGDLIDVWRKAYPMMGADNTFVGALIYDRDMTEFKAADKMRRQLQTAIEASDDSIVIANAVGDIVYVNPAFERITGYSAAEVLGKNPRILQSGEQSAEFYKNLWETVLSGKVWSGQFVNLRKDGTRYTERASISPVYDETHRLINFVAVKHDITAELDLEIQYRQAQKLEAIGQLAAGIAHEINTPMQFIDDNVGFLDETFGKMEQVWAQCRRLAEAVKADESTSEILKELDELNQKLRVDFLRDEIPFAIEEAQDGIKRISEIVRAMRAFSHPGAGDKKTPMDINAAIKNTLAIAKNEWKYVAEVELYLDPNLPSVLGLPGEFNQAILNIVVNAAQSIADVLGDMPNEKGTICIRTRQKGDKVEIRIKDTGTGIPDDHQAKIFEPFFTTKDVGRGTGQGLAITHHIIVEKHHGSLSFETKLGAGTTFIICLPISPEKEGDE